MPIIWMKRSTISLLILTQIRYHLDLLKSPIQRRKLLIQIPTEHHSKLLLKLLPMLSLKSTKVRNLEPQPTLLPWLPKRKPLSTKTPPLEPSTLTITLPTTSFTTNGLSELTHLLSTPPSGLKLPLQETEPSTWQALTQESLPSSPVEIQIPTKSETNSSNTITKINSGE